MSNTIPKNRRVYGKKLLQTFAFKHGLRKALIKVCETKTHIVFDNYIDQPEKWSMDERVQYRMWAQKVLNDQRDLVRTKKGFITMFNGKKYTKKEIKHMYEMHSMQQALKSIGNLLMGILGEEL